MNLQDVSPSCFAVLNEKNRVCDANSGLINAGGGLVVDRVGERFSATLATDLVVDGTVVAPKATKVSGRVKVIRSSGVLRRRKTVLVLELTSLTVDGKAQPILTDTFTATGGRSVQAAAGTVMEYRILQSFTARVPKKDP